MVALPSWSRSRARFPSWQPGETGHGNGFGGVSPPPSAVSRWKPRNPRCPGVLCPSTAGCRVVDRPGVSAPLLLWGPAACLTSFSDVQDRCGTLPPWCQCGLSCLTVKNRPVLVTWFRMALNMADLLYTKPEKIISTHVEIFRHGCCFAFDNAVDFIRFFDYNMLSVIECPRPRRFL